MSSLRYLLSSDWHLGSLRRALPDTYLERADKALRELFATAEKLGIWLIVIAGDLFDHKSVRDAERNYLLRLIEQYDRAGFRIIVLSGNHDVLSNDGVTSLHPLGILSRRLTNTTVAETPTLIHVDHEGEKIPFALIPPIKRHDLSDAAGLATIQTQLKAWKVKDAVAVTHLTAIGSITESGYKMPDGCPVESKRVRVWNLGDIHHRQQVAENAWYPGNPLNHKFGERGPKGALIVDYHKASVKPVDFTAASRLLTVTARDKRDVEKLENLPDYFRIRAPYGAKLGAAPPNVLDVQFVHDTDVETDGPETGPRGRQTGADGLSVESGPETAARGHKAIVLELRKELAERGLHPRDLKRCKSMLRTAGLDVDAG